MIKPMLCAEIDSGEIHKYIDGSHLAERKFNGIRAIIDTTDGIKIYGRNGTDLTNRVVEITEEAKALPKGTILDGEIVAFQDGKEWLAGAQKRCSTSNKTKQYQLRREIPVIFCSFDILMYDNTNLMGKSYGLRKNILIDIPYLKHIQYVPMYEIDEAWKLAQAHEWEGIIIKEMGSPYYEGTRTFSWIKVKQWKVGTFTVKGYIESDKRRIKSLALFDDTMYVGRCGQGLDGTDINDLMKFMRKADLIDNDLDTEPIIVVDSFPITVKYYGYADDGKLRNAILLGIGKFKYDDDES